MIYEAEINGIKLKYDSDNNKIYRWFNRMGWTEFIPNSKSGSVGRQYYKISIKYKDYLLHRVIYKICNPDFDLLNGKIEINHIDENKDNFHISNLEKVDRSQNQQQKSNTGKNAKGYFYEKSNNRFIANYRKDGKYYTKSFSINKYGLEEAEQMAIDFRKENIQDYHNINL